MNNNKKPKEKVGQTSNNSLGQQCFGCQGYDHVKSECPTFLRSKGKVMATTTLSDDEVSDHEFGSDKDGNSIAFTATAVVDENVVVNENPSNGELFESVDFGLKKIASLEVDKKILLLKLFDANELLNNVKIENMILLDKVKNLELELSVAREQQIGLLVPNLITR